MIITFLLTLIPIIAATVIAILTGGGTIQGLLDSISFTGVVVLFVVAIIGSGYGKPFFRIFSSKKKFQSLNLQELKKTDQALEFAGKILFYTAVLIPVLVLIYTLRNFYKDAGTYRHLCPNMAVLLLSILYMDLIEMILCTLKAKTHKEVIMYMADEKMLDRNKGAFSGKTLGTVLVAILSFIVVCVLYGYVSGVYVWGQSSLFSSVFDVPFILIMAVYVFPLLAISGNLSVLSGSIKVLFSGSGIAVSQKHLYLNAVKLTVSLNWYAAFSGAACGWIGMLCNLEDISSLPANLSVSLVPFFYAACLNLFLLLVECRVTASSEAD